MEQTDRAASRFLIFATVIGVILSRFAIGSIVMTVPLLLVCPKVRNTGLKVLSFAVMLLGTATWTIIQNRTLLGTEYWPIILLGLFTPVLNIIGSAVWTVGGNYSRSSMRKFFWASIPVFVLGLAMAFYFASAGSAQVRAAITSTILSMFPEEYLSVDITSVVQMAMNVAALFFAPSSVLALTLPIVIADVNVNRFNEEWQYDFANMKLPDSYVWVFFASWIVALVSNWVEAIPLWIYVLSWNLALTMTVLYLVVGVSILVAFARRRTAAVTAGRIVFLVVVLCLIPVVNAILFIGLPLLGVLETWISFRSEN